MFCTRYSKNQTKKPVRRVKKYEGGGKVDSFDAKMQRGYNEDSGANDLPITVRNRDGSRNSSETARIRVSNFGDALAERSDSKYPTLPKRSARGRAKKNDD